MDWIEVPVSTLQSILDNWIVDNCCEFCDACGEEKYLSITARDGTMFQDRVEVDITHNPDCAYTKIAAMLGKDGRQFWQDVERIKRGHIDLREQQDS